MKTIYTTMNATIANEIALIQKLCCGTEKDFFTIWRESHMDWNHLTYVLEVMIKGQLITKHGCGMCDETYSY